MTPSACLQAAIEILDELRGSSLPADRLLREWARAHRFAGAKDRAAIAERVFAVLRHHFSLAWRMQDDHPRAMVIASLLSEGIPLSGLEGVFNGGRYGPAPLSGDEKRRIAGAPAGFPPLYAQGEFPPFLQSELERAFGPNLLPEMLALASRAPVDLRVNTLKASREGVLARLSADGFHAVPTRFSPLGLRLLPAAGLSSLGRHPLFETGAFEFQDEASQLAALLGHARPGEHVLDLAAGAGGKSLALAAQMANSGEIVAYDIDGARLSALPPRSRRAGATIIHSCKPGCPPPDGPFDLVFVDAPCSGTGIWRRQPELRSRITPARLTELSALQERLLEMAVSHLAPEGRLVYATCSILPSENEERIAAFLARHRGLLLVAAGDIWKVMGGNPALAFSGDFFRATPYVTETDGFFVAIVRRIPT